MRGGSQLAIAISYRFYCDQNIHLISYHPRPVYFSFHFTVCIVHFANKAFRFLSPLRFVFFPWVKRENLSNNETIPLMPRRQFHSFFFIMFYFYYPPIFCCKRLKLIELDWRENRWSSFDLLLSLFPDNPRMKIFPNQQVNHLQVYINHS